MARFRVKVSSGGRITAVRERRTSDPDAIEAARQLIEQLDFLPAHRGSREVSAWVELVFEFAGPDSRVYIDSPKTEPAAQGVGVPRQPLASQGRVGSIVGTKPAKNSTARRSAQ